MSRSRWPQIVCIKSLSVRLQALQSPSKTVCGIASLIEQQQAQQACSHQVLSSYRLDMWCTCMRIGHKQHSVACSCSKGLSAAV